LLKNLIFRQVSRDDFNMIKVRWHSLVETLEDKHEKPLRFLRYFIMSNYPSAENSFSKTKGKEVNVVREDEIYRWFQKNEDRCGYSKNPVKFVDALIKNAQYYVNFDKR